MTVKVIAIKTISNEEVVSEVVDADETSETITLKRPRSLVMHQATDGSVSLGMLPFMASADDPMLKTEADVVLQKSAIMATVVSEAPKALADAYLAQFAGIELI